MIGLKNLLIFISGKMV
jgi:hypothetical protein